MQQGNNGPVPSDSGPSYSLPRVLPREASGGQRLKSRPRRRDEFLQCHRIAHGGGRCPHLPHDELTISRCRTEPSRQRALLTAHAYPSSDFAISSHSCSKEVAAGGLPARLYQNPALEASPSLRCK